MKKVLIIDVAALALVGAASTAGWYAREYVYQQEEEEVPQRSSLIDLALP